MFDEEKCEFHTSTSRRHIIQRTLPVIGPGHRIRAVADEKTCNLDNFHETTPNVRKSYIHETRSNTTPQVIGPDYRVRTVLNKEACDIFMFVRADAQCNGVPGWATPLSPPTPTPWLSPAGQTSGGRLIHPTGG